MIKIEAPYVSRLPSYTTAGNSLKFETASEALHYAERCDLLVRVLADAATRIRMKVHLALEDEFTPEEEEA